MGDFDISDLLSEGSNDSFFEESTNPQKSKLKTDKKQNVADLFNLSGNADDDEKPAINKPAEVASKSVNKDDWLGVKFDEPEIHKEPNISSTLFPDKSNIDIKKPSDLFSTKDEGLPASREGVRSSGKKLFSDLFGREDNQKLPMFDDILSDVKSKKPTELPKEKENVSVEPTHKEMRPRTQRSGLIDPLGLFTEDKTEKSREVTFSKPRIESSPKKSAQLPDWLEGNKSEIKTEPKPSLSTVNVDQSVSGTCLQDSEFTENSGKNADAAIHQQLVASQMQFQTTSLVLQQQEHQVLSALQMKRYEDSLNEMKKQQQHLLDKQEAQFKSLMDMQLAKQQIVEGQLQAQQERINSHLQMLLSQPMYSYMSMKETSNNLDDVRVDDGKRENEVHVEALRQRKDDEIEFMEESYRKQIALLESTLKSREAQSESDLLELTNKYEAKIQELDETNHEQIARYKTKLQELNEEHLLEISSLNEIHSRVVEEIKQEYSLLIENLKRAKQAETSVLENASVYSQQLESSLHILNSNSKVLIDVTDKIEKDRSVISVAKEEHLRRREEELNLMKLSLEKSRESTENERTQLIALVRTLESKLAQQSVEAKEQNLALQVAVSTFSAKTAALDREAEFNQAAIERERDQLKTLRESIAAEQERNMLKLTEERMQLQVEKMKLETTAKLSSRSNESSRADIDAAIAVAKEATELTDREREKLCRQQQDVERMRRSLKDRERMVSNNEHELSVLTHMAEMRIKEAERVMADAKLMEISYNEKLKELKMQFGSLRERESKLAEEKMTLARDRLEMETAMRSRKQCSLCAMEEDRVLRPSFVATEYVSQDRGEFQKVLDPDLIRLQLEVEENDETTL